MMRNTELKPGIWIAALLRRAQVAGAFATLIRKGDPDGGAALLLVRGRQGKEFGGPKGRYQMLMRMHIYLDVLTMTQISGSLKSRMLKAVIF